MKSSMPPSTGMLLSLDEHSLIFVAMAYADMMMDMKAGLVASVL